jgi:molybdenum cofactor biosynthesis enzyme MoaA
MPIATLTTTRLSELWIHTGTACNLECPFCLEDSKPGDTRLQRVTLADVSPLLDEAAQLGVERFVFTGGEPLIVKDIVKILSYALQSKPCLILTNGTAPLIKRAHQLAQLRQQAHALSFRVSIDHPDEQLHDTERGWGNFKRAIEGIRLLHDAGFEISIARQAKADEDSQAVAMRYQDLLVKNKLPQDLQLIAWPEFGRPGMGPDVAAPSQDEFERSVHKPMCRESRMLVKRDGQVRVYACALTDDDARFDLGTSLTSSLSRAITLAHDRCGQCVRRGARLG